MSTIRTALQAMTGIALVVASPALANEIAAQDSGTAATQSDIETLPADLQTAPAPSPRTLGVTEEVTEVDGVETIVRTRYIEPRQAARSIPDTRSYYPQSYYPVAPQPVVFERSQWIEECERRTRELDDDDKGGIIGSLLGAITGGIIGNRVADSERLGGTLIGAGVGGLAGLAIGTLIDRDGDGKDDRYDCQAALDNYLEAYGEPGTRLASRTIPAPYPAYYAPPPGYYGPASYGYAGCNCAPQPQQVTYIPVPYEQRQRVIVRENVREELVPVRQREIPPPQMIKQPTKVVPAPTKVQTIKN